MSRGGNRPGTGRPRKEEKRVAVCLSVDSRTPELMHQLRLRGVKVNMEFDRWIAEMADALDIPRE